MIEEYISHSRFSRPADLGLSQIYSLLYNSLAARLNDVVPIPSFYVTCSMNRICENIEILGRKYIIYDQYMGQSIAQLNRILFFGTEPDELTMAYAFKFIAEDAFLKGNFERAYLFAKNRMDILDRLGEARFSRSRLDANDRSWIGICQECFVIAHELAHQATDSPLFNEDLIRGEWEDVRAYYIDLLETAPQFDDKLMSPEFRELQNTLNRRVSAYSLEERRSIINKGFGRLSPVIIPEIICDRLACHLTVMVMREERGVSPFLVHLGILLAFRYMRIFQYLRNAATFLHRAKQWSPDDKAAVKAVEKDMLRYLMTGPSGLQSYFAWQVREKMLRQELFHTLLGIGIGIEEIKNLDHEAQKHIFFCEENMSDEIAFFVPFNIAHVAPLHYEAQIDVDRSALRDAVQKMLGWP